MASSGTSGGHGGSTLKDRQTAVLSRFLSLSNASSSSSASSSLSAVPSPSPSPSPLPSSAVGVSWKVLLYDRVCQDILSPLLTVRDLRRLGITLHMSINEMRQRVPDVPAIYFCKPTKENVNIIAKDMKEGIYDTAHINFSTSVPHALLEELAQVLVAHPSPSIPTPSSSSSLTAGATAASRVQSIFDQYCAFVCLEDSLFTLNASDSYLALNGSGPGAESDLFAHVDAMVEALFCVCVTMGSVPIIRAKAGHAAEMVADKLDARLREHLAARNNLFTSSSSTSGSTLSFHRPVLLLLDRNFDLATPIMHAWTYQALLADLMGMQSNRVTVYESDEMGTPAAAAGTTAATNGKAKGKAHTYDLLSSEDKFWKHNAGKPFPKVAEGVQERLTAYQTEFNAITRKTGAAAAGGGVNMGAVNVSSGGADDLAAAINALPKLQRRKKLLDTHMNIATALLKEIKRRDIDQFFDVEQTIMQRHTIDKHTLINILGAMPGSTTTTTGTDGSSAAASGKGTFLDRLRFFLVYFLNNHLNEEQIKSYRHLLVNTAANTHSTDGVDTPAASSLPPPELSALDYIQQYKFLHRLHSSDDGHATSSMAGSSSSSSSSLSSSSSSTSKSSGGNLLGNFSKLADSLYGGGVGLLAGVRNLLPANNNLPITNVVEGIMTNKQDEYQTYKTWDPKAPRNSRARVSAPFKDCAVFVLGGGSYNEYQNLQDWQKEKQQTMGINSVVYGCSELLSPEQFVRQLAAVHHASQQATRANLPVD